MKVSCLHTIIKKVLSHLRSDLLKLWQDHDQVHIGKPHLSLRFSVLCRPLSVKVQVGGKELLLYCDVDAIGFEHGEPAELDLSNDVRLRTTV